MIKASMVLTTAFCITWLLRRRAAAERHAVWVAAIGSAAVLPALIGRCAASGGRAAGALESGRKLEATASCRCDIPCGPNRTHTVRSRLADRVVCRFDDGPAYFRSRRDPTDTARSPEFCAIGPCTVRNHSRSCTRSRMPANDSVEAKPRSAHADDMGDSSATDTFSQLCQ